MTIYTCDFGPEAIGDTLSRQASSQSETILRAAAYQEANKSKGILQHANSKASAPVDIVPSQNGLINAALTAWNKHHNLVLRPDDIWTAILSQLGFYINKNTEQLRAHFVAHDGKRQITVTQVCTIETADFGSFATLMADSIGDNVTDPTLKDWILPSFSTTTKRDVIVASVLFMGAMQQYFEYFFDCATCGIPAVTLLGSRQDWEAIQARIHKLKEWGGEAEVYYSMLAPILKYIILSFRDPAAEAVVAFWRTMISYRGPEQMSGGDPESVTGWITGLFTWNTDGAMRIEVKNRRARGYTMVDDQFYPRMLIDNLVPAVGTVPVVVRQLDMNGDCVRAIKTTMIASIAGFEVCQGAIEPAPSTEASSVEDPKKETVAFAQSKEVPKAPGCWSRLKQGLRLDQPAKERPQIQAPRTTEQSEEEDMIITQVGEGANTLRPTSFWWLVKNAELHPKTLEEIPDP